jgi:hypothetical protein
MILNDHFPLLIDKFASLAYKLPWAADVVIWRRLRSRVNINSRRVYPVAGEIKSTRRAYPPTHRHDYP